MGTLKIDVFRNGDAEQVDQDDAFNAVAGACDEIYDSYGIGYAVTKRTDHVFNINSYFNTDQDMLNIFEDELANNNLYAGQGDPRCYLLVYENTGDDAQGQARYNTGDPYDDSSRDYLSQGGRYALGVMNMMDGMAGLNVAIHEVMHTFQRPGNGTGPTLEHNKGAIYSTNEVSPMLTGSLQETSGEPRCKDNGSPNYYVNTLTHCTKSAVDDYMNTHFQSL